MTTTDNELFTEFDTTLANEKMCELKVLTQTGENVPCDNVAALRIGLAKPCGHLSQIHVCDQCWLRTLVMSIFSGTWRCKNGTDTGPCLTSYVVKDAVISVERIKS